MSRKRINIAIDGHSSAGKSTMAKALAKALNYVYIDTGAMYRAATLFAMKERLIDGASMDEDGLNRAMERMFITFKFNPATDTSDVYLGGVNVEKEIRSMEVARNVSPIATVACVRTKLVALQRRMADAGGVVMDGRDIGTVVLPKAELKFFITADPEVRAERRFKELQAGRKSTTYEEVLDNIRVRDRIDSEREIAPLRQAPDAIVLDNSHLTLDEQFDYMYGHAMRVIEGS
jgi:cytidylate kinase